MELREEINAKLKETGLEGGKLLVALSGGLDSSLLARLLAAVGTLKLSRE